MESSSAANPFRHNQNNHIQKVELRFIPNSEGNKGKLGDAVEKMMPEEISKESFIGLWESSSLLGVTTTVGSSRLLVHVTGIAETGYWNLDCIEFSKENIVKLRCNGSSVTYPNNPTPINSEFNINEDGKLIELWRITDFGDNEYESEFYEVHRVEYTRKH